METSRRTSRYDIFKLIVALVLLALFFLLLRQSASPPLAAVPATATMLSIPSATLGANPVAILATSPVETSAFPAQPAPSGTSQSTPTEPIPSPTTANIVTPLATPVIEATSTPVEETPSGQTACESAASRSRLQPGMRATIIRRLNFRSSPGIGHNWLRTNLPGTRVEVVGGPECLPYVAGAYVWWQVKLPEGETGWSAEGSIHGTFYFMEPVP